MFEIRSEESDIPANQAEMGNLFSLYPEIHRLWADTKKERGLSDR